MFLLCCFFRRSAPKCHHSSHIASFACRPTSATASWLLFRPHAHCGMLHRPGRACYSLPSFSLPLLWHAFRWDCDNSPDGAAIHRPKSGVGVVGRGVGREELNCNCNAAASRRKPAATATGGGVMHQQLQLQLRYIPKPGVDVVGCGVGRVELNCSCSCSCS